MRKLIAGICTPPDVFLVAKLIQRNSFSIALSHGQRCAKPATEALVYVGELNRLSFWNTGEAIKVVALGGSVTLGHGPKELNASYVYRFFDWINHTFPNPQHEFLNHALPAVGVRSRALLEAGLVLQALKRSACR